MSDTTDKVIDIQRLSYDEEKAESVSVFRGMFWGGLFGLAFWGTLIGTIIFLVNVKG